MCGRCKKQVDGLVEPVEELCEDRGGNGERFLLFEG